MWLTRNALHSLGEFGESISASREWLRRTKRVLSKSYYQHSDYNIRTLKAKWRQQELVGFLERKRIDVCAIQEHRICHSDSRSLTSYSRVSHFPGEWRLVTHTADYKSSSGAGFLTSPIAFTSLDKVE